jgi:hypothetical protein
VFLQFAFISAGVGVAGRKAFVKKLLRQVLLLVAHTSVVRLIKPIYIYQTIFDRSNV